MEPGADGRFGASGILKSRLIGGEKGEPMRLIEGQRQSREEGLARRECGRL